MSYSFELGAFLTVVVVVFKRAAKVQVDANQLLLSDLLNRSQ